MNHKAAKLLRQLTSRISVKFITGFRGLLKKDNVCPFHRHEYIELVFHPRGSGVTSVSSTGGKKRITFEPGDLVVYPPNCLHDQHMRVAGEDYCVLLEWMAPGKWPMDTTRIPFVRNTFVIREMTALSLPFNTMDKAQQAALNLRGQSILAAILAELSDNRSNKMEATGLGYVRKAQQFLGEHIGEPVRAARLACEAGASQDYLRHLFVRYTGMPPGRWIMEMRVRRAMELLTHSPLPLKAIASNCGFRNERYFSMVFKKSAGRPPGKYRQLLKLPQ